jgi:hypothetical protein
MKKILNIDIQLFVGRFCGGGRMLFRYSRCGGIRPTRLQRAPTRIFSGFLSASEIPVAAAHGAAELAFPARAVACVAFDGAGGGDAGDNQDDRVTIIAIGFILVRLLGLG